MSRLRCGRKRRKENCTSGDKARGRIVTSEKCNVAFWHLVMARLLLCGGIMYTVRGTAVAPPHMAHSRRQKAKVSAAAAAATAAPIHFRVVRLRVRVRTMLYYLRCRPPRPHPRLGVYLRHCCSRKNEREKTKKKKKKKEEDSLFTLSHDDGRRSQSPVPLSMSR